MGKGYNNALMLLGFFSYNVHVYIKEAIFKGEMGKGNYNPYKQEIRQNVYIQGKHFIFSEGKGDVNLLNHNAHMEKYSHNALRHRREVMFLG